MQLNQIDLCFYTWHPIQKTIARHLQAEDTASVARNTE